MRWDIRCLLEKARGRRPRRLSVEPRRKRIYPGPVDAIAVNGLHAVMLSPAFVRADMLRKGRTYELLITRHALSSAENGHRPQSETKVLFRDRKSTRLNSSHLVI